MCSSPKYLTRAATWLSWLPRYPAQHFLPKTVTLHLTYTNPFPAAKIINILPSPTLHQTINYIHHHMLFLLHNFSSFIDLLTVNSHNTCCSSLASIIQVFFVHFFTPAVS